MTSRHLLSNMRPMEDETLVSFLHRAQVDAGRTDEDFQPLVAGSTLSDAWRAERRCFDWESLARFVNAEPKELHQMSQRSLLHEIEDERRDGRMVDWLPWLKQAGYSAHCPCCLAGSTPYWHKAWTSPVALVCEKHQTILVRHCDHCGEDLAGQVWTRPNPICPTCHTHLSLLKPITGTPTLLAHAVEIQKRFSALEASAPVGKGNYELARFAAMWRTAKLLDRPGLGWWPLREYFINMQGLGDTPSSDDVGAKAIRHVQNLIVAHLLAEVEPNFPEHYWHSVTNQKDLRRADEVVIFNVRKIAQAFGISLPMQTGCNIQLTISFASVSESTGIPKAA